MTNRQTYERQTYKQTDRQANNQIGRHTDRSTDRKADRKRQRQRQKLDIYNIHGLCYIRLDLQYPSLSLSLSADPWHRCGCIQPGLEPCGCALSQISGPDYTALTEASLSAGNYIHTDNTRLHDRRKRFQPNPLCIYVISPLVHHVIRIVFQLLQLSYKFFALLRTMYTK